MLSQSALAASRDAHYRTVNVSGVEIFYREAGDRTLPVILLLHGFPTSSHMFRDLIPLLADRYHLIAPDYPGFGYSARPKVAEFNYTFDHLADVMERFVDILGLTRYALYMQDFGGPVGFRLASRRPKQVTALIIQNANAYDDGVSSGVRDVVLRIWKERTPETEARLLELFELPATKRQYLEGAYSSPCMPTMAATSSAMTSGMPTFANISHQPSSYGERVILSLHPRVPRPIKGTSSMLRFTC